MAWAEFLSVVVFLLGMLFLDVRNFEISTGIGFKEGIFPYFFQINVEFSFGEGLDVIEDDAVIKVVSVPGGVETTHQLTDVDNRVFLLFVVLNFNGFFVFFLMIRLPPRYIRL